MKDEKYHSYRKLTIEKGEVPIGKRRFNRLIKTLNELKMI